MKKLLVFVLALALCIPCFSGIKTDAVVSANIYTIVTNPGENSNYQMNISWHADYTYTNCYVEYTLASDASFAYAKSAKGTYTTEDYLWFFNRAYGQTTGSKCTTKFLNYGASLDGLTPNTDYIYRIADGKGYYSNVYSFKTSGAENFSIMWTSDMHMTNYESAKVTRWNDTISYLESIADYDIGLHYNTGDATNCGDRYGFWQTLYGTPVFKKYAYAATIGNHDVYDAMMDDDTNYTQYWKTGKYFGIVNYNPQNGFTQTSSRISGYLSGNGYSSYASRSSDELITVNSGSLSGKMITGANENLNGRSYWFNYGGVLFIVFDYYAMTAASERTAAFNWAKSVIDANYGKYDYLICSEHINLYNGDSGTPRAVGSSSYYAYYQAFLDANNVDFFLAGDNHIYFRSAPLINGAVTNEANKGTIILQAPAITNTSDRSYQTGPAGVGLNKYCAKSFSGGCILNVTPDGIKLEAAMSSDGSAANFFIFETVTLPKKERYRIPDITKLTPNATSKLTVDTAIKGVGLSTSASALIAEFVNTDVRIVNNAGEAVTGNESVGTGYTVSYYVGGTAIDSKQVIVIGDIDGSGSLSSSDYLGIVTHAQGVAPLDGCFKLAADINNSGTVTGADSLTVAQTLTTGTPW